VCLPVIEQEGGQHDIERRGGVEEAAERAHGQGVEEDGGGAQGLGIRVVSLETLNYIRSFFWALTRTE
jgi:hypothetical protein